MKTQINARPFLKWAGNKFGLLAHILPLLPQGKRLIEPFAGSAAVFLNTDYRHNWLNDLNGDVSSLFSIVASDGGLFISKARKYFTKKSNAPEVFYKNRARFNKTKEASERACLFLYLNRHCYNGLCRYNRRGEFNVPFGRYKKPYFPESEIRYFSQKAKKAKFTSLDFAAVMKKARQEDIIYCDPPYSPLSKTAHFTNYAADDFGAAEHARLVEASANAARKGATVVVSNHDTTETRDLYKDAVLYAFDARRSISRFANRRHAAPELLAVFAKGLTV